MNNIKENNSNCICKKRNIYKFSILILLVLVIVLTINNAYAISLTSKSKVAVGDIFDVTLDFGQNIAAYDSLKFEYNSNILRYLSDNKLVEDLWWDISSESTGIRKKVYTFKATGNGVSTFRVDIKGLVSANSTMDELGNFNLSRKVTIGSGVKKGDLDGNGIINGTDASMILDIYNKGIESQDHLLVADMDGNGIVNGADAAILIDMYNKGQV